jgi:pimeloyl-ACP methyl ester carboxylesterase
MSSVVVDSLMTAYQRSGQPDKGRVVILHGWGDDSQGWAAMAEQLAEAGGEVTVLDLPGFGGTEAPKTAWGLDEYAAFVGKFLKKIRLKPDVVIGHSNGGAIAIRGLATEKFSTSKLVLLDSAGIRGEYQGRTRALRAITKTGKLLSMPLPPSMRKKLRQRVYTTVGSDLLVAEHLQETFKKVVTDDVQADAAQLKLPTLLVYGQDDAATPTAYGRMLRNLIDSSQLEIIPEAGHFAHLDKPDEVLSFITQFLKW